MRSIGLVGFCSLLLAATALSHIAVSPYLTSSRLVSPYAYPYYSPYSSYVAQYPYISPLGYSLPLQASPLSYSAVPTVLVSPSRTVLNPVPASEENNGDENDNRDETDSSEDVNDREQKK